MALNSIFNLYRLIYPFISNSWTRSKNLEVCFLLFEKAREVAISKVLNKGTIFDLFIQNSHLETFSIRCLTLNVIVCCYKKCFLKLECIHELQCLETDKVHAVVESPSVDFFSNQDFRVDKRLLKLISKPFRRILEWLLFAISF